MDDEKILRDERHKNRNKLRKKIRLDLIEQLSDKGLNQTHYLDLVDDYVSFWDIKCELIFDINENGVSRKYKNGENQWGFKKNDSIAELNRVNNQMLTILRELGLRAVDIEVDIDEEFKL